MDRRITASNHYIHARRTINERPVMEFKEVVEDRYSCKKFNGEPVAEKALKAILEAGRVAPTAKPYVAKTLGKEMGLSDNRPRSLLLSMSLPLVATAPPQCLS